MFLVHVIISNKHGKNTNQHNYIINFFLAINKSIRIVIKTRTSF